MGAGNLKKNIARIKNERKVHEKKELAKNPKYLHWITIPNFITMGRLILTIPLCFMIATKGLPSWHLALAAAGLGLTDAIDGWLAKHKQMSSRIGSIADPIADKVFNWGIVISLFISGLMPLWSLIPIGVIAIRDITVWLFCIYQFTFKAKHILPTQPARIKMFLQSLGTVSAIAFGFGWSGNSLISPIFVSLASLTFIPEYFAIKNKYFSKK